MKKATFPKGLVAFFIFYKALSAIYIDERKGILFIICEEILGKLNRRNFCWCHCGFLAKPGNRFINGHNKGMLGKHPTEETKQNMRKPKSEEGKQNIKIAQNRLKRKKERSQLAKIAMNKPEVQEKRLQSLSITNAKPEVKEKNSQRQKKRWQDPEYREKQLQSRKTVQSKIEVKEKHSKSAKKNWQDPEFAKMMSKAQNRRPTKPELLLDNCFHKWLPAQLKYTGNGTFWINGKNPDFVDCNGQKKIIEFNGDWWHRDDIPDERESIFAEFGYDTLIIWEHELKDMEVLKIKVDAFMMKENPYSKHAYRAEIFTTNISKEEKR